MTRFVKRGGKIWIRLFPDKPVTKKPAETRMGKGKERAGSLGRRGAAGQDPVRDGRRDASSDAAEAMRLAFTKLPLRTSIREARNGALEKFDEARTA